jgi:hypothetical protein
MTLRARGGRRDGSEVGEIASWVGVDVGNEDHHPTVVSAAAERLFEIAVSNDEAAIEQRLIALCVHSMCAGDRPAGLSRWRSASPAPSPSGRRGSRPRRSDRSIGHRDRTQNIGQTASPVRLAISLIATPSTRCNRLISAHCCTPAIPWSSLDTDDRARLRAPPDALAHIQQGVKFRVLLKERG